MIFSLIFTFAICITAVFAYKISQMPELVIYAIEDVGFTTVLNDNYIGYADNSFIKVKESVEIENGIVT